MLELIIVIFCFCFDKNDYLCNHNISLSKYGQRHQSHQSGACSTCVCQASGKALPALALSLSRQGVVFFAVLLIASALFEYQGILASQCAADLLSAALAACILLSFRRAPERYGIITG